MNMSNYELDGQADAVVKLHRMLNALAQAEVGDDVMETMVSALMKQMEDGYRLAFPILAGSGRVLLCVALLARANDPRLKAVRQLRVSGEATHVLIFLAFASEREWVKQATQMSRLFPEQPDKPEWMIAEK